MLKRKKFWKRVVLCTGGDFYFTAYWCYLPGTGFQSRSAKTRRYEQLAIAAYRTMAMDFIH